MNILDYLDKESPEVSRALTHGFRRGDADAVGRCLLEEIKARKLLVKVLNERIILCENEFPGIKDKLLELDEAALVAPEAPAVVVSGEVDEVISARLSQIDDRIDIIASGLVTIVNSLVSE